MDPKPTNEPETNSPEKAEVSDATPKEDPKNAAGSVNPKEKGHFYEAVTRRQNRRKMPGASPGARRP